MAYLISDQSSLLFSSNPTELQEIKITINTSTINSRGYKIYAFTGPEVSSESVDWIQTAIAITDTQYRTIELINENDLLNRIGFKPLENTDTNSRSYTVDISIHIYGTNTDLDVAQSVDWNDLGTEVLSVNIIQDAAPIEIELKEIDVKEVEEQTGDETIEIRKKIENLKDQAEQAVQGAIVNIIQVNTQQLLEPLISKFANIQATLEALNNTITSAKEKLDSIKSKKEDLESKLNKEDLKHFPNESKKKLMESVKNRAEEEINDLESKIQEYEKQAATFTKDQIERLKGTILGSDIYKNITNLKTQAGIIGKAVPALAQNAGIAAVEPMGAVVVTPTGPGSVATNAIQIAGTVKRLASQASALITPLNSAIDSAIFLGLPESYVQPLVVLSTSIAIVAALA